jgi:hypothetical protein
MDPTLAATDPQALATIEAAKLTAKATISAAWIQAGVALGAIAGGALAYFGAVRQVRLQERAYQVRALAYCFRLAKVLRRYHSQVSEALQTARAQLRKLEAGGGSVEIATLRVSRPHTLHDENWETHALLGRRAVELILLIEEESLRLGEFDQEIASGRVKTDAVFQSGSRKAAATEQGAVTVHVQTAIYDYVDVLTRLQSALEALMREIERPPGRPSMTRQLFAFTRGIDAWREKWMRPGPGSRQDHFEGDSSMSARSRIPRDRVRGV